MVRSVESATLESKKQAIKKDTKNLERSLERWDGKVKTKTFEERVAYRFKRYGTKVQGYGAKKEKINVIETYKIQYQK